MKPDTGRGRRAGRAPTDDGGGKRDIVWAPWRIGYILGAGKARGCFLCATARSRQDRKNLVLMRGRRCFAIMNRYPYNNGHIMIAPRRHVARLSALNGDEATELMRLAARWEVVLSECLRPDGFNIGFNLGKVAGAGLEDHLHLHIVPRWNGDTNFMPVLANTKVISEALDATYDKLKRMSD